MKQERDVALWQRHLPALERVHAEGMLIVAREQLARVSAPSYLEELVGTIGADPFTLQIR